MFDTDKLEYELLNLPIIPKEYTLHPKPALHVQDVV